MPLVKGASNQARQENIRREISTGKDPKQAVAIGYSEQRRAKKMATTSAGPNMAYSAPSKPAKAKPKGKVRAEAGEIHEKAQRMFKAGQITKAAYDKICAKADKLRGK